MNTFPAYFVDIKYLAVAHDDKTWQFSGEIDLCVKFDRTFVRTVARPVIFIK